MQIGEKVSNAVADAAPGAMVLANKRGKINIGSVAMNGANVPNVEVFVPGKNVGGDGVEITLPAEEAKRLSVQVPVEIMRGREDLGDTSYPVQDDGSKVEMVGGGSEGAAVGEAGAGGEAAG